MKKLRFGEIKSLVQSHAVSAGAEIQNKPEYLQAIALHHHHLCSKIFLELDGET